MKTAIISIAFLLITAGLQVLVTANSGKSDNLIGCSPTEQQEQKSETSPRKA